MRLDQVGDDARIEVRTTGPGMPTEQAQRVFERFYRVDPARARTSGGSGLGLSIVAAIVAAHGGMVSASSGPGGGMTVTVLLPMTRSTRRILRPKMPSLGFPSPAIPSPTIPSPNTPSPMNRDPSRRSCTRRATGSRQLRWPTTVPPVRTRRRRHRPRSRMDRSLPSLRPRLTAASDTAAASAGAASDPHAYPATPPDAAT